MCIENEISKESYLYEQEMSILRKYCNQETKKYLKLMDDYIKMYENSSDDSVKARARQSLIRSGVLTKNGKPKRNIVNR